MIDFFCISPQKLNQEASTTLSIVVLCKRDLSFKYNICGKCLRTYIVAKLEEDIFVIKLSAQRDDCDI